MPMSIPDAEAVELEVRPLLVFVAMAVAAEVVVVMSIIAGMRD